VRPRRRLWPCGFAGCQETVRRCRAARLFLSRNAATGVGIKNKKAGTPRSPTPHPGLHAAPPSCLAASPPLLSVVAPSRHQCDPHVDEWHTSMPTFLKGCLAAIRRLVNLKHCSLPPLLITGSTMGHHLAPRRCSSWALLLLSPSLRGGVRRTPLRSRGDWKGQTTSTTAEEPSIVRLAPRLSTGARLQRNGGRAPVERREH